MSSFSVSHTRVSLLFLGSTQHFWATFSSYFFLSHHYIQFSKPHPSYVQGIKHQARFHHKSRVTMVTTSFDSWVCPANWTELILKWTELLRQRGVAPLHTLGVCIFTPTAESFHLLWRFQTLKTSFPLWNIEANLQDVFWSRTSNTMKILQYLGILLFFWFEFWWISTSESSCVNMSIFWFICLLVVWGLWQIQQWMGWGQSDPITYWPCGKS